MFVQRSLFKMKPKRWGELKELFKKQSEQREEGAPTIRVYVDYVGPMDTFVLEWEWESMADFESTWAKWNASPDPEFFDTWHQCVDYGISSEIWKLVEF